MEENKRRQLFLSKTKRLDTIKKKASELSILCNVDVCLVGTHDDPSYSQPSTWQTWPEDRNEVVRILEKYKKRVGEKDLSLPITTTNNNSSNNDNSTRAVWEFDVDKGLERMSEEELKTVLEEVDRMEADVDRKLVPLLTCNHHSGTHATPMTEDLPSDQTMEEPNSDMFDSESTHSTSLDSNLTLNLTMKQTHSEELNSKVAKNDLKLFGVFVILPREA